jgi:hypothetical protein
MIYQQLLTIQGLVDIIIALQYIVFIGFLRFLMFDDNALKSFPITIYFAFLIANFVAFLETS